MNKRKRLLSLVINQPWAMRKEVLEQAVKFLGSSIRDLHAAANDSYQPNVDSLEVMGKTAVINVIGPITRFDSNDSMSSRDGYATVESTMAALDLAMESPEVKNILLNINSPGGSVDGISELALKIRNASKPVHAYIGGEGASAAYWLASQAKRITISNTAFVGSIGVYTAYLDISRALDAAGIDKYVIVASQSPNKIPNPATDEGRAQIQTHIDALAQIFIETVAAGRGVSVETVAENFGKGDIILGADAVGRGMVDALGTFESALDELNKTSNPIITKKSNIGGKAMDVSTLKAEFPEVAKALMDEGAATERARIQSIEEIAGADNSEIVKAVKYDGKTTGEMAAVMILKAEREKKALLIQNRQADAGEMPAVVNAGASGESPENVFQSAAALIVAAADKMGGKK